MAVIEPIYATLAVEEQQNTVNLAMEPDILPTIIEGISPEVELEEAEGGVQMTVTTKSGEKTALIPRGQKGETGEKGDAFTYADFTEEQKTELIQGPISSAQDAAVQAVEKAGQEVLDSIPPDYQQMVDDVTDMANRKADKNGTVLTSTLSRGRKANTTIGPASFAFGYNVEASGAESFAEGTNTVASGNNAHAEGGGAVASGLDSHAHGWRTTANHRSQTVFGECNVEDPSAADSESRGTYVEIVGNGTGVNARSNARTLDWSGNEVLAGDLTVNAGKASAKTVSGLAREVSGLSDSVGHLRSALKEETDIARVSSLDSTVLAKGTAIEAVGIPVYVDNVSPYAAYGITDKGWYVFARVAAHAEDSVTAQTTITGAAGYIATVGEDHIDLAVRFDTTAQSVPVTIHWGTATDHFTFKASDLAVRNLDYRVTFYIYDIAPYAVWTYALTADTTFTADKQYYTKDGDVYTLAEVTAGEAIPADTYYDHSKLTFSGMVPNVTYKLDEIVDCPIEIVLPEVADDGHGAWFEIQMRYDATRSCTLIPPAGVKIGTAQTQAQSVGINTIDLQYTIAGEVKMWTLLNTHANIPA